MCTFPDVEESKDKVNEDLADLKASWDDLLIGDSEDNNDD